MVFGSGFGWVLKVFGLVVGIGFGVHFFIGFWVGLGSVWGQIDRGFGGFWVDFCARDGGSGHEQSEWERERGLFG